MSKTKPKKDAAPESPPVCPYCGQPAALVDTKEIYGRSYGPAWLCRPCDAYVGCHKGTTLPLGTLADKVTRAARISFKARFNKLWEPLIGTSNRSAMTRDQAYEALSAKLQLPLESCHGALFDAEMCQKGIAAVRELILELPPDRRTYYQLDPKF